MGANASPLHIISHGSPGTLYLGSSTLELSNIEQYRPQLQKWGIAHLYIYGCKVAAGDAGAEFLTKLHQITQASIAASNTLTGNAALGGNWELETKLGEISPPVALKPDIALTYKGILGASDLDPTFGTGGIVITPILNGSAGRAITIDSSGKILVAGWATNGSDDGFDHLLARDFALARYNSNGTLDTTFDIDGIVTTDILKGDEGNAMTIDSSGKILVAGSAWNDSNFDFALARYNSDGTLDTSFGNGGKVTTDFASSNTGISSSNDLGTNDSGYAMTIDNSGKILVAGVTDLDFALARYNSDGTLDTSFGNGGKVTTDFAGGADIRAITIDSSGKILVAGYAYNGSSSNDFALARYNSDGTLDASFDTDGVVTTDFGSSRDNNVGYAMTIDSSSGKILVAGVTNNGSNFDSNFDFALARYNSDGTLDTSFDTDGKVTTDFFGDQDSGFAITIDSSGKILVAGVANNGSNGGLALARYNSNGTLDTSFDTDGKVTTSIGSGSTGTAITIDSSGKILVAGGADNGSSNDFALVRYGTTDGTTDNTPVVDGCPPMPTQPIVNFELTATIEGTNNDDILAGNDNANIINSYTGNDFIQGGATNDTIIGGSDNATVDNDIIFGNSGNDLIQGSAGNDIILGGQDNDIAFGGQGDDLLWGDRGSDTLMGDDGNDVIYGGPGDPSLSDVDLGDVIYGGLGNDILLGNQGNNSLSGGDGNEWLFGGRDNDLLHGDAGNDFLYGDKGDDTLCAGDGDDTLYGGTGSDTGVGQNGEKDLLHGGAGNDIILGSEGDDTLEGDIGDDTLYGGKDSDIILGGDGSDILSGDRGNDTLTGGGGSDTFRILAGNGIDIITDFTDSQDKIGLAGGLTFSELSIFATTDGGTGISFGGETLAILNGINVSIITSDDFMSVG